MEQINSAELKAKMDAGENVLLLDVREPDERAAYNIGGIFLPLGFVLSMQTDEIAELKDEEIVCYCRSGKRSLQACMMLETMGFSKMKNLEGGMLAWQEKFG